jgi:6-methylsalicylate decarboxylase
MVCRGRFLQVLRVIPSRFVALVAVVADTVGHFHVPALRCACESFGADRLVLGTDFPYLSGDRYRRSVAYIEDAGLSTSDAQRILEGNAASLLQLDARVEKG